MLLEHEAPQQRGFLFTTTTVKTDQGKKKNTIQKTNKDK